MAAASSVEHIHFSYLDRLQQLPPQMLAAQQGRTSTSCQTDVFTECKHATDNRVVHRQVWHSAGSRSGNAMQFYSWQKYTPVGPPMVEPKWIQWDPDVTAAALAYADSLVVCRARPTFKAIASLSIQVCQDHHKYHQASRPPCMSSYPCLMPWAAGQQGRTLTHCCAQKHILQEHHWCMMSGFWIACSASGG